MIAPIVFAAPKMSCIVRAADAPRYQAGEEEFPRHVVGFFTPTRAQIARLESKLDEFLSAYRVPPGDWKQFRRQYIGVIIEEEGAILARQKLIWINAWTLDQATDPCAICCSIIHGGFNFWNLKYDPAIGRFGDLIFDPT